MKLSRVPKANCNSFYNLDVNHGSLFDTIDNGTPCNRTISSTYKLVNHRIVNPDWYKMGRLYESINNHPHRVMFLLREGKTQHKIHGNIIPLALRNWKGIQQTCWNLVFSFDLLTRQTFRHVLCHITFHSFPPIMLF